jgi:hypothetical protein
MKARVRAEIGGRGTDYLYGDGRIIHPAIRLARSPRQYDSRRRAIAVPHAFLDDILAALELQSGVDVELVRVPA